MISNQHFAVASHVIGMCLLLVQIFPTLLVLFAVSVHKTVTTNRMVLTRDTTYNYVPSNQIGVHGMIFGVAHQNEKERKSSIVSVCKLL